jgi:hypothetical protein
MVGMREKKKIMKTRKKQKRIDFGGLKKLFFSNAKCKQNCRVKVIQIVN